jgi:hypothetical protein
LRTVADSECREDLEAGVTGVNLQRDIGESIESVVQVIFAVEEDIEKLADLYAHLGMPPKRRNAIGQGHALCGNAVEKRGD